MSINACSINAFTINSLRCRSIVMSPVIPSTLLRSPKSIPSLARVHQQHDERELDLSTLESAYVEIQVELLGSSYTYGYENLPYEFSPTVMVTSLVMTEITPVITISELNISEQQ